ncbi:Hypothetical protein D9617_49g041350 [Elsinoe fawcettii]|nr:Hypothetical protein D9617_49g041350 [Elsinoe fawcettii]
MDMQPPRSKIDKIDPLVMRRGMLCSIVNFPKLPTHIPRITEWSKSAGADNLENGEADVYIRLSDDSEAAKILYTWSRPDGVDDSYMLIAWYYSEVTLREHAGNTVAAYWPWRAELILSDHLQVVTSASVLGAVEDNRFRPKDIFLVIRRPHVACFVYRNYKMKNHQKANRLSTASQIVFEFGNEGVP